MNEIKDKPRVNKASRSPMAKNLLFILVAITAGFFGGYVGSKSDINSDTSNSTRQIIEGEGNLVNTIASDVSPSVVSVNVTGKTVSTDFFGNGQEFESKSAGTGVILNKDGLIITNRHVVPDKNSVVAVVLSDGTELEAEVVGKTNRSDPLDIAFLKIKDLKGKELVPAKLGDSEKVVVGDRVVAIGNALGQFQNTVTSGIISGYGRDIQASDGAGTETETLQNLFQTDAAINSGNSGGPLVNSASEVIGINVATASAENISFAIPINDIKSLIDIVLETGKLDRPYLGVRYVPLDEDVAKRLDIEQTEGAYIPEGTSSRPSILSNSPAEKAGLKEKDVIIKIDGQKLDDKNGLVSLLGRKRVGDSAEIIVIRDGSEKTLFATLEVSPEQ